MESIAKQTTLFFAHSLEIVAAVVIAFALIRLIPFFLFALIRPDGSQAAMAARTWFGTAVALSLELLLGADVLATAVAPDWNDIGHLAAIAALRTALNFFLEKELTRTKS